MAVETGGSAISDKHGRGLFHRLRDGLRDFPPAWRSLLGFVVLFVLMWIASAIWGVAATLGGRWLGVPELLRFSLSRSGGIVLQIAVFEIGQRFLTGRSLLRSALALHRLWWADLLIGLTLSALGMGLLFLIYRGGGWLRIEGWAWDSLGLAAWLAAIWSALLVNVQAALNEEFIFRGFLQGGLREGWKPIPALLVTALIFAALHLFVATAGATPWPLFILALLAPSLMLGWVYLKSGSLWLPLGLHFAWNLVQTDLLNLVGDGRLHGFGAITTLDGPAWLLGTDYGIEVGLLMLLPLLINLGGAWLWLRYGAHRLT